MPALTCPQCGTEMTETVRSGAAVGQCPRCQGLFLRGADRGLLIELENDWHLSSGPVTQPIPRITPGMAPPPAGAVRVAPRAFLDELFG
jgi:TFIIB-like protein